MNTRELMYQTFKDWGFHLVKLAPNTKRPVGERWYEEELQENEINDYNWGLLLSNVVDVDIDDDTFSDVWGYFAVPTFTFGRGGRPTHYIYRSKGAKYERFIFGGKVIVELRHGDRMQTMVPPSVHPDGDLLSIFNGQEPSEIEFDELLERVSLALLTWVIRPYYVEGVRQNIALRLPVPLYRAGFNDVIIKQLIAVLCDLTGDNEMVKRDEAVDSTLEKIRRGENVEGLPSLITEGIIPQDVADFIMKILSPFKSEQSDMLGIDISKYIIPAPEFVKRTERIDFVVDGVFPKSSVVLLAGEQKSGKTFVMLDICSKLSRGGKVFDIYEGKRSPILIIEGDMPNSLLSVRLNKLGVGDGVFVVSKHDLMRDGVHLNLSDKTTIGMIRRMIEEVGAELVFIDTISSFHSKNENSSEEMKPIMTNLVETAQITGSCICFLHHTRKRPSSGGGNEVSASDIVGTNVFQRFTSANYMVTKKTDQTTGKNVYFFHTVGSWFKEVPTFQFSIVDTEDGGLELRYSHPSLNTPTPLKMKKTDRLSEEAIKKMIQEGWSVNQIVGKYGLQYKEVIERVKNGL